VQEAPAARELPYDHVWRCERVITTVEQRAAIWWIAAERAARV
jgi:hypothetical protein